MARAFLGTSGPVSGEALCAAFGVPLRALPPIGRVPGIYAGDHIAVRLDIPECYREDTIYHEMGHHFIHGPYAGYLFWEARDPQMNRHHHKQARDFAYFAALPGDLLTVMLCDGVSVWQIAREYRRSYSWMQRRIALANEYGELDGMKRQMVA